MNRSQIKVTLEKICDVYGYLIKFVRDAEKYIVSGRGSVDFSQMAVLKDELGGLILSLKSFADDRSLLEDCLLSAHFSKLRGQIVLYNKMKDDFIQLSTDSIQFYNTLLNISGSFYNQKGKILPSLPNTVLMKA